MPAHHRPSVPARTGWPATRFPTAVLASCTGSVAHRLRLHKANVGTCTVIVSAQAYVYFFFHKPQLSEQIMTENFRFFDTYEKKSEWFEL